MGSTACTRDGRLRRAIGTSKTGLRPGRTGSFEGMSDTVLFVGIYEIPPGGLDAFYSQAAAMTEVVRREEPRVIFIGHYVSEDETEGTSVHLHPDPDSFDFHMAAARQRIEAGTQLVRVKRIEFYGRPSEAALDNLSKTFDVRVKSWADGFSKIDWS